MQEIVQFNDAKMTPKGRVKLELFDADTGEKVLERSQNNYVKQSVVDFATDLGRYMLFEIGEKSYSNRRLFQGLIMTNNSKPTAPSTERFIEGNVIGYGMIDTASSTATRGAFNSIESVVGDFYYKLVFDFPTSAGNGTFQSIYTARFIEGSNLPVLWSTPLVVQSLKVKTKATSEHKFTAKGGYLYRIEGSALVKYKLPSFDSSAVSVTTALPLEVVDSYTLSITPDSYEILGSDIYYAEGKVIYKAPLSSPDSMSTYKTLGSDYTSTNTTFICHSPKNNNWILYNYSDDCFYFYDFSMSTQLAKIKYTSTGMSSYPGSGAIRKMYVPKNNPDILVAGYFILDIDTMKLLSIYHNSAYSDWGEINDEFMLQATVNSTDTLYVNPSSQFFSRVLLDSPVTKTSQNTMKITYEFNMPSIDIVPRQ